MTNTTDPDTVRHADPAVQALIDSAWLGHWDDPIEVSDLASAVNTVRTTDRLSAVLVRTEYAATTVMTGGQRDRAETGDDRRQAEVWVEAARNAAKTMLPDTLAALGVVEHLVESREVYRTADGWEHTSPWQPADGTETSR